MTRSFNCASCSAPLDFKGEIFQKCAHCGSTVIAPHDMFYADNPSPFADLTALKGRALKIAEIQRLIHDGRKIEAIKVFREAFGTGLKESKDAVEAIERGESVDISGMRVQTAAVPGIQIDAREVKRAAMAAGKVMSVVGGLFALLVIGGVGLALYFTMGRSTAMPFAANVNPQVPPAAKGAEASPAMETLKFGGEGNGAGKFMDNRHVAVDGNGRIYSSDYSPMRVQVFDAEDTFITQWKPAEGTNLYDLAADREGNVYVANDRGVFKFEGESGKQLAKSERIYPTGMALTWDGKVVVTAGKAIHFMDKDLKTKLEIKDAAERADSTFGFEAVAVDGDGVIYTFDRTKKEICKFGPEGKFLDRFSHGANAPHAIAIDASGRLFISDTSSVKVLDREGKKLNEFKAFQAFGITFNQAGEMFMASRPHVIKYVLNL